MLELDRLVQAILDIFIREGWTLIEEPARDDGPYNARIIGWDGTLSRGDRTVTASGGWRTLMLRRLVAQVLLEEAVNASR